MLYSMYTLRNYFVPIIPDDGINIRKEYLRQIILLARVLNANARPPQAR